MKKDFLNRYIMVSSVFCVFSENFGYLHYFIMITNSLLFIYYYKEFSFPIKAIFFFVYLVITGFYSIVNKTNTMALFLAQLLGVLISCLYFYNFFKVSKYNVIKIFEYYCKSVYWVSLIGIFLFTLEILTKNSVPGLHKILFETGFDPVYRLHSIMFEPAHFCGVSIPAFYYYLKNIKQNIYKFIVISTALLFSLSSVGYLFVIVSLIFLPKKFNFVLNIAAICVALFLGYIAYTFSENVKVRVNDTAASLISLDVTDGVNLSTYALVANVYVVEHVFLNSPIIGNGFGSHQLSHKKYIDDLPGADLIPDDLRVLNSTDANSLFLRITSDLGLLGLLLVFYFIKKNYSNSADLYVISRAILIYFLYKLFRDGHYFSPEMYFFVAAYYYLYKESRRGVLYDQLI